MISKKDLEKRTGNLINQVERLGRYSSDYRMKIKSLDLSDSNQYAEISKLKQENQQLVKQLQCAAKGHNFIFDKVEYYHWITSPLSLSLFQKEAHKYLFRCSNCNLTIVKTKNELTPKEKKALIDLKILEENNAKTKTTN